MILSNDEIREELLQSKSFLLWSPNPKTASSNATLGRGKSFRYSGRKFTNLVVDEKHFTCSQLATAWGVSVQTIRAIFQNEEGVLKIGRDGTRTRRRYKTLRIPQSVAERVHTRLSA